MVRFVERRSSSLITAMVMGLGALVVPLMAASLFIKEWISIAGFLVITVAGYLASFALIAWWERQHQTTREVRSGSGKKAAAKPGSREPQVFLEAIGLRLLITFSIVFAGLVLLNLFAGLQGPATPRSMAGHFALVPIVILLFALWAAQVRLIVGTDEVRAIHPWLRVIPDRSFRFGEIETVETREGGRSGWQVLIRLHDRATIGYQNYDRARIDALLAALADGVARSKPASDDLDELV